MKKIGLLVIACLTMLAFTGCEKATINLLTEFGGSEIDLCDRTVREYLDEDDVNEQSDILWKYMGVVTSYQNAVFEWEGDGSLNYKVYFADNKKMKDARVYETQYTTLYNEVALVPGRTYYWKVEGDQEGSTSKVDKFVTKDAPVRFITTDSIVNVRDIGGWKAGDKKVKYELIYRGGRTNKIDENLCSDMDKKTFAEQLGIKTEIDLRTPGRDDGNQSRSVFGDGINYLKAPIAGFTHIIPGFTQTNPYRTHDSISVDSIRMIFERLGDEDSYPVYFHCNAGADRTGTLAFLINGVLGVSYEDLTRDFEVTSFSEAGKRWRSNINEIDHAFDGSGIMQDDMENYVAWDYFYNQLMEKYSKDGNLQNAVENYLIDACKVNKEDIEVLKKMMLE